MRKKQVIKDLLDDASKLAGKLIDGLNDNREDVLFGDIIEGAKPETSKSGATRKYAKTTIFKSLMIEFVLTLLFGYIGIPALFRRNKIYGVCKFGIALAAVFTLFYLRSWYLIVPAVFLYALDLGIMVSRLVIFIKGKRFAKKFDNLADEGMAESN